MDTSIRYECDGKRRAFLIPFPYGGHGDVGASLIDGEGVERALEPQVDYVISEHYLVTVKGKTLAEGCALSIWLATPLAKAEAGGLMRVAAAELAGVSEAAAAYHAEAAARTAAEAALEAEDRTGKALLEYREAASKLEAQAAAKIDEVFERTSLLVEQAAVKAKEDVRAVSEEAIARAANPGISAVRSMGELETYSQGFFVINPRLKIGTPFMGFWPARKREAILWDGFFAIIPGCQGHGQVSGWENPGQLPGEGSGGNAGLGNGESGSGPGTGAGCGEDHWLPAGA